MITCQICQREFETQITNTHLRLHDTTTHGYKALYGEDSLTIPEYRKRKSQQAEGENNPNFKGALAREKHPLYERWRQHLRAVDGIVQDWTDFWAFVEGVGERPGHDYKLYKKDPTDPMGPTNFEWKQVVSDPSRAEYMRNWNAAHPKAVLAHRLRHFNITVEEYLDLIDKQDNKCAICREPEKVMHKNGTIRTLAIDHCHATNKIRGLLCTACNSGISNFKDDTDLLARAIAYLNKSREFPCLADASY